MRSLFIWNKNILNNENRIITIFNYENRCKVSTQNHYLKTYNNI